MLVYELNSKSNCIPYEIYNNLTKIVERNKLDIIQFEIPEDQRHIFLNEQILQYEKQYYIVKNIEDMANTYRIEAHQDIGDWYQFNTRGDFPYHKIDVVLDKVKPDGWTIYIKGDIPEARTIKADHKQSFEVLEQCIDKYNIEYRLDNYQKTLTIGKDLGLDLGSYFMSDFNIDKQDINVESFEFATRIIPEGMNGLKINQINDGKDYLENKAYSDRTITYYWKDERYTNIQNLKNDAQKKLDLLSVPTLTIDLSVQDLNEAINAYRNDYKVLDYVWLIDSDRKVKEKFKIIKAVYYADEPFNNEISLNNKPLDLVDDEHDVIELTKNMWEYTRTQFEAYDGEIKASVETAKRYTDDSFKTYKTERLQTDEEIRESITESTTYVDPETGQTKPIVDKALEIVKTIDGIEVEIQNAGIDADDLRTKLQKYKEESDNNYTSLSGDLDKYVQEFNVKNGKLESNILGIRTEVQSDISNFKDNVDTEISGIRDDVNTGISNAESNVKRYVIENFSTISQTDEKITLGVSSLKTDIDDLEGLVKINTSNITQTQDSIDLSISQINRSLDGKVDTKRIISEINASEEGIKISGDKVDIDASKLDLKVDEITTTWSRYNTNTAIHIKNSTIDLYNNSGAKAGGLTTGHYVSTGKNIISLGHDSNEGTLVIDYGNYPYMTFDEWGIQRRHPITVHTDIEFLGDIYGYIDFKNGISSDGTILCDGGFATSGESAFNGKTTFRDNVYLSGSSTLDIGTNNIKIGSSGRTFSIETINYSDDTALRFKWTDSVWFEYRKSGSLYMKDYSGVKKVFSID